MVINVFSKKIFLGIVLVAFPLVYSAQTSNSLKQSEEHTNYLKQLYTDLDGTYQIQMINTRSKPAFNLELLETIKSERKENDTIFIPVSAIVRIMVLPKSVISSPGFIGVPQIKHLNL